VAGTSELIVRVEEPGAELMRALDRLSRETGVPVSFVEDGPALVRRLRTEDRVLLVAEGMIMPRDWIDRLAASDAPALLVTPSGPETAHLERVDAGHVWAGGALLAAGTILATVDMLGEWDLVLTLLRRAVQQDAARIELPAELVAAGRLGRPTEQAEADRMVEALSREGGDELPARDLLSAALAPVRRRLVAELARHQVKAGHLGLGAAMLSLGAVALVNFGWILPALGFALLGEAALALGRSSARLMLEKPLPNWLLVLVKGSGLTVLAVTGGSLTGGAPLALSGVLLPLALVALTSWADEADLGREPVGGRWARLGTAMILLLILAATLLDMLQTGYLLLGLCAFGTVGARLLAGNEKRI
jgi:hypothetical protein